MEGRRHPLTELPERLRILDELRDSGVISAEEHAVGRQEILRGLSDR